jgi:hypothetical protein
MDRCLIRIPFKEVFPFPFTTVNQLIFLLFFLLFSPLAIGNSSVPVLVPGELLIPDSRAHKLLVSYCQGWHLIPFPEVFSRHSGTCLVIGDRNVTGPSFQIKVGDCFRLGSVGLVVSEMKIDEENEQKIDAKTLQFLKDEALAFDTNEDMAALASDEMGLMKNNSVDGVENNNNNEITNKYADGLPYNQSFDNDDQTNRNSLDEGFAPGCSSPCHTNLQENSFTGGLTGGEKFICYMCYETHNTSEDPLIAPCECKGDTRFLHVHCLQKWYHTSAYGSHAQVVRTTGNGAPACKICGAAYKTNFKRQDGRKASILEVKKDNNPFHIILILISYCYYSSFLSLVGEQRSLSLSGGGHSPRHQSRSLQHQVPTELRSETGNAAECAGHGLEHDCDRSFFLLCDDSRLSNCFHCSCQD